MPSFENQKIVPTTLENLLPSRTGNVIQKSQHSNDNYESHSLFCSSPALAFVSEFFQSFKNKGAVASHKGGPAALFCASDPVTHVDDDDDDDDEKDNALALEPKKSPLNTFSGVQKIKSKDAISSTDAKKSVQLEIMADAISFMKDSLGSVKLEKSFANGDSYCGFVKDYLPNGHGKYIWLDGCMYTGEWERGKESGRGNIFWPSGATYEGDVLRGYIHGTGTYRGVDGTSYRGNWNVNLKQGLGRMKCSNGDVYEGSWEQGERDGLGKYTWANGNVYFGHWKCNVMSGNGTLTWRSGDMYNGEWLDGLQHGRGVYGSKDGSFYIGSWNRGLKHGKGVFIPARAVSIIAKETRRKNFLGKLSSNSLISAEQWRVEHCVEKDADHMAVDKFRRNGGAFQGYVIDTSTFILEREYVQGLLINEIIKHHPHTLRQRNTKERQRLQAVTGRKRQGETICEGHGSYGLMLTLQLGIRYTLGKVTREAATQISPADFGPQACVGVRFPKLGSTLTPCHESVDFMWKDYCPKVFRHLREMFMIDTADYMLSLCGDDALRELQSPGKSGSVFLLSNDERFMIKTLRRSELKVILRMLPSYYNHVRTYQNTLLTKFFGVHQLKPFGGPKVQFVVMGNMLCTDLHIHRKYDLKGSLQGRWTADDKIDEHTTLKDLDLEYLFHLKHSCREILVKQIEYDCKFLESQAIMDYSLLIGLHFRAPPKSHSLLPKISTVSAGGLAGMDWLHRGSVLIPKELVKENTSPDADVHGIPLGAPVGADGEINQLLPIVAQVQTQLGVIMPARADLRFKGKDANKGNEVSKEVHEVVLYVGIIDILQAYGMTKQIEHAFKSLQYDPLSISSVGPKVYAKRFQEFVSGIFPSSANQPHKEF